MWVQVGNLVRARHRLDSHVEVAARQLARHLFEPLDRTRDAIGGHPGQEGDEHDQETYNRNKEATDTELAEAQR